MDIDRLQKNWSNLGRRDPFWAILSDSRRRGGEWKLDDFLQTGHDFVWFLVRHLQGLQVELRLDRALDFGCGYGRLTQGLAKHFTEVVGLDIAATMIEGARQIDRSDGRCEFVHHTTADLGRFDDASFDFALTALVLQHMRPQYSMGYLRELLRLLRPGGALVFQLPIEPKALPDDEHQGSTTAAVEPVSAAQLRGSVSVHPGYAALAGGQWIWLRVYVHNAGQQVWRAGEGPGQVQLGVRWQQLDGAAAEQASFLPLPGDLAPGAGLRMNVPVRSPVQSGQVVAQVQLVLAGRWIEQPGLGAGRLVATVAGCAEQDPPADPSPEQPRPLQRPRYPSGGGGGSDEAEIEVYGVSVDEVVAVVSEAGGELVDVTEDDWAGPDWLSAHYTVYKR